MIQAELCQGNQISILNEQFSIDVTFNIFYSKAKVDKNMLYTSRAFSMNGRWILSFRSGPNIFQGGGPTFSRWGVQLLFPIETHITCDFPGGRGSGPPLPPLDPHLKSFLIRVNSVCLRKYD